MKKKTRNSSAQKPKKPLYKKWWVWVLGLLVITFLATPSANDDETISDPGQDNQIVIEDKENYVGDEESIAKNDTSNQETGNNDTHPSNPNNKTPGSIVNQAPISADTVPAYSGSAYVEVNGNTPYFNSGDYVTTAFERYSNLDSLGRCGVAYANICKEIMPTEKRGEIGMVKPSGWHTVKYDCVDGKYLYNRCHLIGYQLAGENANEKNLITGTRYLNIEGMLPFENMVADYVQETGHHVLYRVTPLYSGNNLLASGVLMEGYSVEDKGDGISFCVFAYNAQPGVTINYETGESELDSVNTATQPKPQDKNPSTSTPQNPETPKPQPEPKPEPKPEPVPAPQPSTQQHSYILNTNTRKFHVPGCPSASRISDKNRGEFTGDRASLITQGYEPCKNCNP